jgi:branched-chain amino acid transport system substrate-binding protein
MNKTAKIAIGIAVAVLIIAGGWYFNKTKEQGISDAGNKLTTIKIGVVGPLSGDAASYGEYVFKSIKIAIDDYNKTHKALNFEAVYEDGKCDGSQAVTALNKLINIDKVHYVIGGVCSTETLAMAPIAESNKIILFTPWSTSPNITNAGDYIFRNIASDDYGAKEIAKIAVQKGDKKIGLIAENTDYAQSLKNTFKKTCTSLGGEVALDESFNTGTTDFRTIITKAKSENVSVLYAVPQLYKTMALMLKQMKELGYQPKLYSNDALINSEALKYYDPSYSGILEGAIFTQAIFDEENAKTKNFLAEFTNKYGSTEGPLQPVYLATGYDSIFLLGAAITKSGDNPEKVKDYLYTIKNWDGVIKNFSFDQNGDAAMGVEAETVKNGKIVPLSL